MAQQDIEILFFNTLKRSFPTLSDAIIPDKDNVSFVALAMEPRFEGEARELILAAIASDLKPKLVVVVNSDINIKDPNQINWAMSCHMKPHEDILIVTNPKKNFSGCTSLNGSALNSKQESSVGMDATRSKNTITPEIHLYDKIDFFGHSLPPESCTEKRSTESECTFYKFCVS